MPTHNRFKETTAIVCGGALVLVACGGPAFSKIESEAVSAIGGGDEPELPGPVSSVGMFGQDAGLEGFATPAQDSGPAGLNPEAVPPQPPIPLGAPGEPLDGFRLESKCREPLPGGDDSSRFCQTVAEEDRQTQSFLAGGDPSQVYELELRVRGVAETVVHEGGMQPSAHAYVGGRVVATQLEWTSFSLRVARPPRTYHFNHNVELLVENLVLDYVVTVEVRGGTLLTLEVNGEPSVPDGMQLSNHDELVAPGEDLGAQPFDGQFIQLGVLETRISTQFAPNNSR